MEHDDVFGGIPLAELVALVGRGFATWLDTDPTDAHLTRTQTAMRVCAPADITFDTVVDFARMHEYGALSLPGTVKQLAPGRVEVKLSQGLRFGFLKLGLEETLELQIERPHRVRTLAYRGGSFSSVSLSVDVLPVDARSCVLVVGFLADLQSVGLMASAFFRHQPELEFAITGNVPLVPTFTWVQETERRVRANRSSLPEATALSALVSLGSLEAPLRHGYLTQGRLHTTGAIRDMASAARLRGGPAGPWGVLTDPARISRALSFVEHGKATPGPAGTNQTELDYVVKVGPFRKRYEIRRTNKIDAGKSMVATKATADGVALDVADHLFPRGENTVYCHRYYTDIKRDRIAAFFLKRHPEFERLICTYSPTLAVRAMREIIGAPT
jgi:hypothetical protein